MPHRMTSPQLETNCRINFCFLFQRLFVHLSLAPFTRAHTWDNGLRARSFRGFHCSPCPGTPAGFLFSCPFVVVVLFGFLNSVSWRPPRCVSLKKEVDPQATAFDLPHSPKHVWCLTFGFFNSSKPVYNYQSWCHLYITELQSCKLFINMKYSMHMK